MIIKFLRYFIIALPFFIVSCTRSTIENANQKTIESFSYIKLVEVINELIQLDMDTVYTYNQAIQAIKKEEYRNQLISFRNDHERHIRTLSKAVIDLGGYPPSFSSDLKGFVTSGYTAIKVSRGTKNALEAMETNEIISNRYYTKALSVPMPEHVKTIIRANKQDEERHLKAIRNMELKLK
ncbi:MAG: ferritin-like domain-containing protein [Rickettsiaceae bacterium]|nr:ferritin-like domain-containing protein [Rickettsiaceae bacterium]